MWPASKEARSSRSLWIPLQRWWLASCEPYPGVPGSENLYLRQSKNLSDVLRDVLRTGPAMQKALSARRMSSTGR